MAGGSGERGEHGQRLQPQRVRGKRRRGGIEIVAHEDEIELAALGGAADLPDRCKILEAVNRAGITPAGDVAACAEDEQAEMHLSFHGSSPKQDLAFKEADQAEES